jgi:uncharacterized protein (TIGR02246 family)
MSAFRAMAASWTLAALLLAAGPAGAAGTEDTIRRLEQTQTQAALAGDSATLTQLFAPDFRIVNPTGAIGTGEQLLKLLTGATHPYAAAKYTTELVRELGDVVVTVGMEEVVPNQGPQAGQVVQRRVTQVWKREHGRWMLTLRHAMVVPKAGG